MFDRLTDSCWAFDWNLVTFTRWSLANIPIQVSFNPQNVSKTISIPTSVALTEFSTFEHRFGIPTRSAMLIVYRHCLILKFLFRFQFFCSCTSQSNLVPRARARLGQRRPRVHGLWDNQQPEARFLASGLKADTADPREGGLGIYLKDQKKRQPPPLPFANNSHSLGLPWKQNNTNKRCKWSGIVRDLAPTSTATNIFCTS